MIDLRSDTVTRPTAAMFEAMRASELGDDVLGDDPTVQRLEARIAAMLGKEAACFVPSGTMANQTAIRAQTDPGDEVIAHRDSHIVHYETGAVAGLAGCQVCPLEGPGGQFEPEDVVRAIRPGDAHYPRSRLLVIENTHNRGGGTVWPTDQFEDVCVAARRHGLTIHLDGARLFNACVALGVEPTRYTSAVDTVSVCFSKGLGAPAGSAVAGSVDAIHRVRRLRKMFGGAMRQSGLLAGAALYALDRHVSRLAEDHRRARVLGESLAVLDGLSVDLASVQTNMVFFELAPRLGGAIAFCGRLRDQGVSMLPLGPHRVRAVTHLDVDDAAIQRAIEAVRAATGELARATA